MGRTLNFKGSSLKKLFCAFHLWERKRGFCDALGRRLSADDWSYTLDANDQALFAGRGFTGHEHLPEFGLINMNGRLYDPLLGRFLSPDNNVQMPDFSQSFNRYSYAFNNPLIYTDPDGEWAILDDLGAMFIGGTIIGQLMDLNLIKKD